ncbi:hypothetical protein VNO77_08722 [Canavalia gladiata]|uniref:Uncharacterized protein n=1 Tax=Canavalia gladiata TaxID=3824 RepID=A0AAN9MA91_CANGL
MDGENRIGVSQVPRWGLRSWRQGHMCWQWHAMVGDMWLKQMHADVQDPLDLLRWSVSFKFAQNFFYALFYRKVTNSPLGKEMIDIESDNSLKRITSMLSYAPID